MSRSVKGFTAAHYSLPTSAGDLGLIAAVGDSVELAYHKSRVGGTITLLPTKVPFDSDNCKELVSVIINDFGGICSGERLCVPTH